MGCGEGELRDKPREVSGHELLQAMWRSVWFTLKTARLILDESGRIQGGMAGDQGFNFRKPALAAVWPMDLWKAELVGRGLNGGVWIVTKAEMKERNG